ncbi:MAG: rhodanese-like domain-containing protein, partial [Bacteroidota bacterium]|nr:rhodanese-like domain-containing protein [Bacteroidota bacterium]
MNDMKDISNLLPALSQYQFIDVRSPGEFSAGHIPGAINIPLFTDEERSIVGTLYNQTSPEAAMYEGLKIAGAKLDAYLSTFTSLMLPNQCII